LTSPIEAYINACIIIQLSVAEIGKFARDQGRQ